MTFNRSAEIGDFTGRTLEGIAYKYDRPSRVTDDNWATSYYEEVLSRADTRTLKSRASFPVDIQHDHAPIGQVAFQRSADERALMFTATIDRSTTGDKVLAEIEDWNDVSVSFDALRNVTRSTPQHGPIIGRAEIRIDGLSLAATGTGLYKDAQVLHVRAAGAETPRLSAVRKRLILL